MTTQAPPKFEKKNHHFIPQFWIGYFADTKGQLWKREGGRVSHSSTAKVMAEDWLYTEFDRHWQPGDGVEDRLSKAEAIGGRLFADLHAAADCPSDDNWAKLCWWVGLTACRHPVAMQRGLVRAKELAWSLADISAKPDEASFLNEIRSRFGVSLPVGMRDALAKKGEEGLLEEAEEIEGFSPQDPRLPMLIALEGASAVALKVTPMDMVLLDAPAGKMYVLGDTPLRTTDLAGGFALPLSSRLALAAWPPGSKETVLRGRCEADEATVDLINLDQADRARAVVVGPDRGVLLALSRP